MSLDFDAINLRRDRKLRWLLLDTLFLARGKTPSGGVSGPLLMQWTTPQIEMSGLAVEDDEHALRLLGDLRDRGYIEVHTSKNRRQGERFKLVHVTLAKITAKGVDLHEGNIDPDRQVDDGREQD